MVGYVDQINSFFGMHCTYNTAVFTGICGKNCSHLYAHVCPDLQNAILGVRNILDTANISTFVAQTDELCMSVLARYSSIVS